MKHTPRTETVIEYEYGGLQIGCCQTVAEMQEVAKILEGRGFPSGLVNIYRQAAIIKQAAIDKATK